MEGTLLWWASYDKNKVHEGVISLGNGGASGGKGGEFRWLTDEVVAPLEEV